MLLLWTDDAWQDYMYWQSNDKKVLRRINTLIKDIRREPYSGLGNPEPLKHNLSGYWSRRINREHRLVYKYEDKKITIVQSRYHY